MAKPKFLRSTPINYLPGLYSRAYHSLYNNGFRTLDDLLQISQADYDQFCWVGKSILDSIKECVAATGHELPMVSADWVREAMISRPKGFIGYPGIKQGLRERNSGPALKIHVPECEGA